MTKAVMTVHAEAAALTVENRGQRGIGEGLRRELT